MMNGKTVSCVLTSIEQGDNVEDLFIPMDDASFKHCRDLMTAIRDDMCFIEDMITMEDGSGKFTFRAVDTPYFHDPGDDKDYVIVDRVPLMTDIARITAGLSKVVEVLASFQQDKTIRQLMRLTNTTFKLELKSDVFDDFEMSTRRSVNES